MTPTIIIYGYSKTSKEIIALLKQREYNYVIIECDTQSIKEARDESVLTYNTPLTKDENLKKIGIGDGVEAIFCMHKDKNLNLFVTFSARNLDPNLKIITLVNDLQDRQKMILAGASRVISPHNIGGYRLSRMIKKPTLLDILDTILFKRTYILRAEITVTKGSFLDKTCFNDLTIEKDYDIIVIGVQDHEISKDFVFHFSCINHNLDAGDVIVVLGYENNIERLKRDLSKNL